MQQNVSTIIAPSTQGNLTPSTEKNLVIALKNQGATISSTNWLAENEALDIIHSGISPQAANNALKKECNPLQLDTITQGLQNRKKKFLISDMDSTIINQECIDELADTLGIKDKVAAITERAMNGELDFSAALIERIVLLKGLKKDILLNVYQQSISLTAGAKTLVQTMRKNGAYCLLVSGGFTFFTEKIANDTGFNDHQANQLDFKNGELTGKVIEPILDKDAKKTALLEHQKKLNIKIDDILAIGDGANDLPMLLTAGLGVAYHAKPNVKKQTHANIDFCDLKAVLYAQGYNKQDFAADEKGTSE